MIKSKPLILKHTILINLAQKIKSSNYKIQHYISLNQYATTYTKIHKYIESLSKKRRFDKKNKDTKRAYYSVHNGSI